ncbi:hypothetical protein IU486_27660 [Streptomyces gardneri]|uniref:hypothetical protein n=1 Tax=Nocardia TaxID=1817 RepID=UPI00135B38EE|nr:MULTISPECIES: hypothetical protein [Nocardia]MBF6168502.1 hypothetical protein [Streptomyces gardneri]MBF6207765.1 hypothetical protein [Streptomyces gardneri]
MPAQDRRYIILLDPGRPGDEVTLTANREKFFDWLRETRAEVVQDGGANRVVITSGPEVAEQATNLDFVAGVEPFA